MTSNLFTANSTPASILGEVVCWELPPGTVTTYAALRHALHVAGLDENAARPFCNRHAFVRAIRAVTGASEQRIARALTEDRHTIEFQLTKEFRNGALWDYSFEARARLDKATGVVTSDDAQMEARLRSELLSQQDTRRTGDVTRLIQALFAQNADLFPIKGSSGVYFVPQAHVGFVAKVEAFVRALSGDMKRFPVPEGTPQGTQAVEVAVTDGMSALLSETEEHVRSIAVDGKRCDSVLGAAAQRIEEARRKVREYRDYLGGQWEILSDQAAYVRKLLDDKERDRAALKAGPVAVAS